MSIDTGDMKPPMRTDTTLPVWGTPLGMHIDLASPQLAQGPFAPPRDERPPWNRSRCAQGVVYLGPTPANGGGTRILSGFHHKWDRWLEQTGEGDIAAAMGAWLSAGDLSGDWGEVLPIEGDAGDLVIWDSFLPHGNGSNTSDGARLCEYVNMWPAEGWATQPGHRSSTDDETDRRRRLRMWDERLPGGSYSWPPLELPDARAEACWRPTEPAKLTALGERLLGLRSWD